MNPTSPLSPLRLNRELMDSAASPASAAATPSAPEDQTKEIAPFLRSLRRMLDRESDDILCWTTDGRAFEIHDMEVMTTYILPKYFKHAKYTSFQRQLNYFNFRKWTKSRATVCTFSNAFFVRDEPDLTWRITRKRGLSDGKAAAVAAAAGGSASDMLSPRSPKTPKPRAAVSVAAAPSSSTATVVSTAPTFKRELSVGSKRKATSSGVPMSRKAAKSTASSSASQSKSLAADAVDSLEWVDTLYPSLEALEAECSATSTSSLSPSFMSESSFAANLNSISSTSSSYYSGEHVPYAWPQYSPALEDAERLRLSTASAFFAPTMVQASCVAL